MAGATNQGAVPAGAEMSMPVETVLYVFISLLLVADVFDIGYCFGKLRRLKEAQSRSSHRLSVLAGDPKPALERLVSTNDPSK